jgi:hypothetical protein
MTNYVNIQNGIIVNSVQNSVKSAVIKLVTSANLKLSTFHVLMFLYGAKLHVESLQQNMIDKDILSLYMSLNEAIVENVPEKEFEFTSNQLRFLEQFLISRLNHCERERDAQNNKFNPDTYISMKLMLLDIKQLMLGEILELVNAD